MSTTWSTDADIRLFVALAEEALVAYSDAQVAKGRAAVTTFDVFRDRAYAEVNWRLAQRGLATTDVSRAAVLVPVEAYLAAAILFDSVGQWRSDGSKDIYSTAAEHWRARHLDAFEKAAVVDGVRAEGRSFEVGRG